MDQDQELGGTGTIRPKKPPQKRAVAREESGGGSSRRRTPWLYDLFEGITEGLLYFMVVFSPWAFGTTQPWSIWVMNIAAYLMGGMLIAKWMVRWQMDFSPARWGVNGHESLVLGRWTVSQVTTFLTRALAVLTCLLLLYCLVSAVNARAVYREGFSRFEYFDGSIGWLPHSYHRAGTWAAFWQYFGLALAFWAVRDWLLGKTRTERRSSGRRGEGSRRASEAGRNDKEKPASEGRKSEFAEQALDTRRLKLEVFPDRLKRLFWVLCVNGGLLALVGILQRLDNSNRLLWLIEPYWNKTPVSQFGPYAYRANAAQYFNLLWPLCLGFWWFTREERKRHVRFERVGQGPQVILLPLSVLMAAAPFITTSRGGAGVALVGIVIAAAILILVHRGKRWGIQIGVLSLMAVILGFAGYFGWGYFQDRLQHQGLLETSRWEIYQNARKIAEDYPLYGTGPGTFPAVYHMYRKDSKQEWQAYAHNDWLETRVTFGWLGSGVIFLMAATVVASYFLGSGMTLALPFIGMIGVALAGCLVHARFDFPFQIHSILFMFLLECAILFSAAFPGGRRA